METFLVHAPAAVVAHMMGHITAFLPSDEIVTIATSLNKPIEAALRDESELWSRVVLHKLQGFYPARAFFDGPINDSNNDVKGTPMRDFFVDEATLCDTQLDEKVQRGGITAKGAVWIWSVARNVQLGTHNNRTTVSIVGVACRTVGSSTSGLADFRDWAMAFECEACRKPGSAQRQCVVCASMLCLDCCRRCDADGEKTSHGFSTYFLRQLEKRDLSAEERISYEKLHASTYAEEKAEPIGRCAFALCGGCHDAFSLGDSPTRTEIMISILGVNEPAVPGLYQVACRSCPKGLYCPAHVNLCILMCGTCQDEACANHSTDEPMIMSCRLCGHMACYRYGCWNVGERRIRYCADCHYMAQCEACAPGFKCVTCGKYMTA